MRLSLPAIIILALSVTKTSQQTIETSWSSNNIGSDGPWQGVEVTVGDDQTMTLYPGSIFYSWLIPPDYCDFNRTLGCSAGSNGLYNKEKSFNQFTGSTGGIQFSPPASDMSRGLDVQGPPATSWIDQMTIASSVNVPNVSVAIVNKPGVAYPDGKWYPLSAGCLGLGGFGSVNQTFGLTGGSSINASLIPGHLWESGRVSSNSFGMHIGSAVSGSPVPGSLQWGGYDKSRVLGDVLTTHNSDGELFARARLTGLSLEVADGISPFNTSGATEDSLLGSNGEGEVDVDLDGCSPYLSFSKATCDRIAEHLPLTYDNDLGLYLWDTTSQQYPRVVSSASSLAFTIESPNPEGDRDTITVRVPFAHLNLTLSAPLKSSPTPYFPCFTGGRAGADAAVLGRAFLQDAFLGANWATKTWWLAQAPGPRLGNRDIEEIAQSDVTISGGDQAWADSWRGTWTPLEEGEEPTGPPSSPPPPPSTSAETEPESSRLPTGAIAGIGVGAGVLVIAAIGGLVFFFLRRKRKAKASELHAVPAPALETEQSPWGYGGYNTHQGYAGKEVYKPQTEPAEMYTGGDHQPGYTRQELP